MVSVITIQPPSNSGLSIKGNEGLGDYLNFSSDMTVSSGNLAPNATEKKKRGRPKKETVKDSEIYLADKDNSEEGPEPYKKGYDETDVMLKTAIAQLDMANADLDKDLSDIRSSKTLRKKYDYISNLVATKSSVISSKITAIREINASTTKAYELELKRAKEFGSKDEINDDKTVMDMYNSMISMPYGNDPTMQQMVLPNTGMATFSDTQMYRADIDNSNEDLGYQTYMANLTPEQNLYMYENDPNVEQVIQFDPESGARRFAYINKTTMQEIPNLPTMPEFLMEEFTLNPAQGIARSSNLGQSLPIVTAKIDPMKAAKF